MSASQEYAPAEWPAQDARDRGIATATPMVPAPKFGPLPPLMAGQHRFVAARNGLFVQARSEVLAVCLRVGRTVALPYAEIEEGVSLPCGLLPVSLFEAAVTRSVRLCPKEWAGLVVWDRAAGDYRLVEPPVEARSASSVRYALAGIDRSTVVVDLHSHGEGEAYFSATDDLSDAHGVYLACVLGRCARASTVTVATRVVVNGIHYDVPWSPWAGT